MPLSKADGRIELTATEAAVKATDIPRGVIHAFSPYTLNPWLSAW